MQVYRSREGLNRHDTQEINDTFNKHLSGNHTRIGTQDIGRVLRSIGYNFDFDTQQALVAKVDVTGQGWLDAWEVRKLVRMVRNQDIDMIKNEFYKVKAGDQATIP